MAILLSSLSIVGIYTTSSTSVFVISYFFHLDTDFEYYLLNMAFDDKKGLAIAFEEAKNGMFLY